jgi:C1A family cysteine protease
MNQKTLINLQSALQESGNEWTAGETPLLSLSDEQQKTILGAVPPEGPPTEEDKKKSRALAMVQHEEGRAGATAHPSSFDWRNRSGRNFVTPIKNQGGCGSCVAFGVLAGMESIIRIKKNNPNYIIDLSEAHLFYCLKGDPNGCTNGWWPSSAYDKIKVSGVALEKYFPYTGSQQACKVQNNWQNQRIQITGHQHMTNVNDIKEWISKNGPVSACFEVFQDFFAYKSGVYRHISGNSAGWHCISVIGYNDAGGYWIAKNSWGTSWGDNGFFKIKYGDSSIEKYGMWGALGVTNSPWIYGKKVQGIWTNDSVKNAHVFIENEGWLKIKNANENAYYNILDCCIAAKGKKKNVNVRTTNAQIDEVYG